MPLSPSSNVLCVPSVKQNIISVSQFCRSNNTSIEFFPSHFFVKDLCTRLSLLRGRDRHDLYEWPMANPTNKSSVVALSVSVYSKVSPAMWHGCLGHPFSKLLKFLAGSGLLSLSSSLPSKFTCESCLCNKRKRLPFGESSLESCGPLDLVYTDVWGLSLIESVDGFHYYVIFVDHFTKYIWLYPLRLKSDVFPIFRPFKAVVEFFF